MRKYWKRSNVCECVIEIHSLSFVSISRLFLSLLLLSCLLIQFSTLLWRAVAPSPKFIRLQTPKAVSPLFPDLLAQPFQLCIPRIIVILYSIC